MDAHIRIAVRYGVGILLGYFYSTREVDPALLEALTAILVGVGTEWWYNRTKTAI